MKRLTLLLTLLGVFFASGVFAQKMNPVRYSGLGQRLIDDLKLSETQVDQINEIRYKHQEEAIEFRSLIEKNRLEMRKLAGEDEINIEKLMQLTDENSAVQAKMKKSGVKMWTDIYQLLDPEQKKIWASEFNRRGMGIGMGPRFDRPGRCLMGDRPGRFYRGNRDSDDRPFRNRERLDWDY